VNVDRQLLRIEDVCIATSLGRTKVYELISAGQIKAVKIGKAVRVPADEVTAFVDRTKAEAGLVPVA
jgi:excisionase family DNA binding protein